MSDRTVVTAPGERRDDRALRAVAGARTPPAPPSAAPDEAPAVDEWGATRVALAVGRSLAALRWRLEIGGLEQLPQRGGALLVTNPRPLALVAPMVALAVGDRLGRTVRFTGVLDVPPASLLLRRIGGVLARPEEVESALAGGDLVVVGAGDDEPGLSRFDAVLHADRRAGVVPVEHIAAARRAAVPIHPVAAISSPFGRTARAEIAPAVRPRLDRRGLLGPAELAERVRLRLQQRLDEISSGGH